MLLVGGLLLPVWLAWTAALTSTGYPAEATTRAHSRSASQR